MSFLYFIEGTDRADAATLRAKGLAHVLFESGPADIHHTAANKGPGGKPGVTVRVGPPGMKAVKFWPDDQEWRALPGGHGTYIGWWKDEPVTMASLARRQQIPGVPVKLLTGETAIVPVARRWTMAEDGGGGFACALDQAAGIDSDGNWTIGQVVASQASLWGLAQKFHAMAMASVEAQRQNADGSVTIQITDLLDDALAALAANYRIGRAEAAAMGIFGERVAWNVLCALTDWDTFTAWADDAAKKAAAAPAGSST